MTCIFVLSGLLLLYTYTLYPLVLWCIARWSGKPSLSGLAPDLPRISVIIPFHNEERWVARKLENTRAWDYPPERLEIVAVSDGSTDRTNAILMQYQEHICIVSYQPRQGKPTALNRGTFEASGEILVLTDANVLVEPQALRAMIARFGDPSIGGVSGNVALQADGSAEPLGEGLYMRYERWLYALDSATGTMVGADGALFSVRRELFQQLPVDTIVDDFAIALGVIARGKSVVYEPEARGVEIVVPDVRAEFQRKVRMIAGGYQALARFWTLLNPLQYPIVALQLLSHKLLRWGAPLLMGVALVSSGIGARDQWLLRIAVIMQGVFYGLALLGWVSPVVRRWLLVYVPHYFCAVNLAAVAGLWRFLRGAQAITWQKASR